MLHLFWGWGSLTRSSKSAGNSGGAIYIRSDFFINLFAHRNTAIATDDYGYAVLREPSG